jgi:hypothetical protein
MGQGLLVVFSRHISVQVASANADRCDANEGFTLAGDGAILFGDA